MGGKKDKPGIHCLCMCLISWELSCYICTTVMSQRVLSATPSAHFLTNDRVLLIVRTPAPFSALQQVGTSDMSLKTVRVCVASILDYCW